MQRRIQDRVKHVFFFPKNSFLDVGIEYPSGKKLFKVLTFFSPLKVKKVKGLTEQQFKFSS